MLTALLPGDNPGTRLNDLFEKNPSTSIKKVAQALGVSRSTAWRRAKEQGWTLNEQTKLWVQI